MSQALDESFAEVHNGFEIAVPLPDESGLRRSVDGLNSEIYCIEGNNRVKVRLEHCAGHDVVGIYPVEGVLGNIRFYRACGDHPFIEYLGSGEGVQVALQNLSTCFYIHFNPFYEEGS
ncbi:hypothetical protein GF386_01425 [Candidatus Pacearchaeota archaeon]|nr:hypothetical protein [Candidatus Pacearchaeota archaeon]